MLQIEISRPGNIALAFAHLFLNMNEKGHAASILRLPAAGTNSIFAREFTAMFGISGDYYHKLINGISIPQKVEADEAFLFRTLQRKLFSGLISVPVLLQKLKEFLEGLGI